MRRTIEKIKERKAITLIALIVTIVVILILAGITVGMVTSDNGILKETKNAKQQAEIDNEKSIVERAKMLAMMRSKNGAITYEIFEPAIKDEAGKISTDVSDAGDTIEVLFKESNRYYEIDQDGNVSEPQEVVKDEYAGDITKGGRCDGSEEKPYEISCIEDLVVLSNITNGKGIKLKNGQAVAITKTDAFQNKNVILTRNLNFKSKYSYMNSTRVDFGDLNEDKKVESIIEELQKEKGYTPLLKFYGKMEGNYKSINNIYIYNKTMRYAGFISTINGGTTIQNLTISGEISNETNYVAGICGTIENNGGENGKIVNCHNYANIYGNGYVGGIVGYIREKSKTKLIANCSNHGTIKHSIKYNYVGGIVANTDDTTLIIENCYNEGEVEGSGIAENNKSFIKNCYNIGKTEYGLVRINQNEIENCYNAGKCMSKYLINKSDYVTSHIYNCFSEKDFAEQITLNGTIDNISMIFDNGYMKTDEFLNCLNNDTVWIKDTANINKGYPILKWQVESEIY